MTPSGFQLAIDGSQSVPERVVRKGFCGCGCGERVFGRRQYVPLHRQRAYRERVRVEMERAGLPASPSLRAAGVSRSTSGRNGDASNGRKRAVKGNGKPSGLQVSYFRAVEVLAPLLAAEGIGFTGGRVGKAREEAERVLRMALSDKQREVLDRRERKAA